MAFRRGIKKFQLLQVKGCKVVAVEEGYVHIWKLCDFDVEN